MDQSHCDLVDQAKLQVADTKKRVPKDPSLRLIVDRSAKRSDRSRGDSHEADVGQTSTSSFTRTSDVVEEQSSSCNTRFSIVEGDGT